MNYQNDDLRIKEIKELLPPVALLKNSPLLKCREYGRPCPKSDP